jgi:hypothetical protein
LAASLGKKNFKTVVPELNHVCLALKFVLRMSPHLLFIGEFFSLHFTVFFQRHLVRSFSLPSSFEFVAFYLFSISLPHWIISIVEFNDGFLRVCALTIESGLTRHKLFFFFVSFIVCCALMLYSSWMTTWGLIWYRNKALASNRLKFLEDRSPFFFFCSSLHIAFVACFPSVIVLFCSFIASYLLSLISWLKPMVMKLISYTWERWSAALTFAIRKAKKISSGSSCCNRKPYNCYNSLTLRASYIRCLTASNICRTTSWRRYRVFSSSHSHKSCCSLSVCSIRQIQQ